ncbi:hypothetical protein J6590_064963 [Homalodisca vitripennis]|nr:hypothetical protein J6590_064963 [Homalodisca vitripennis]
MKFRKRLDGDECNRVTQEDAGARCSQHINESINVCAVAGGVERIDSNEEIVVVRGSIKFGPFRGAATGWGGGQMFVNNHLTRIKIGNLRSPIFEKHTWFSQSTCECTSGERLGSETSLWPAVWYLGFLEDSARQHRRRASSVDFAFIRTLPRIHTTMARQSYSTRHVPSLQGVPWAATFPSVVAAGLRPVTILPPTRRYITLIEFI